MGILLNYLARTGAFNKIFDSLPHGGGEDNIDGLGHHGIAHRLRRNITQFGSGWRGSFEEGLLGNSIPEEFASLHPSYSKPNLSFQWLEHGFVRHEEEDFASHLPGYLLGKVEKSPRVLPFLRKNWKIATAIGVAGLWATRPLSWFSGKDDNYNSIEGLRHGGVAGILRKKNTEFGSGWDPLRKFAAEAGTTLEKLVRTPSFRDALSSGRRIHELGEGSFGRVSLLESTIKLGDKEHTFQFASKIVSKDSEPIQLFHEVKAQRKLQDLNAPNVYGYSGNKVFMEPFKGQDANAVMQLGGTLPESFISDLENFVPEMHRRGIAHIDMARDVNNLAGRKTQFGETLPHNVILTPEGRAGVIDYGLATSPGAATKNDQVWHQSFAKEKYATNAELDMSLVTSLRKNQGKLSSKGMRQIDMAGQKSVTAATAATGKRKNPAIPVMAAAQRETSRQMFAAAASGGKRSRSVFGASTRRV